MTVEELAVKVVEVVDCGCCVMDLEACLRVAKFIRAQYSDIELQDEEVDQRIRTMMDDLYNYEVFTGRAAWTSESEPEAS